MTCSSSARRLAVNASSKITIHFTLRVGTVIGQLARHSSEIILKRMLGMESLLLGNCKPSAGSKRLKRKKTERDRSPVADCQSSDRDQTRRPRFGTCESTIPTVRIGSRLKNQMSSCFLSE